MVKKKTWALLIVLALIVSIIAVFGTQFAIPSTDLLPGSFISVPTYGVLKCEQSDTVMRVPQSGFTKFSSRVIGCGISTGQSLPQECTVTFKMPSGEDLPSRLTTPAIGLLYSICSSGNPCNIGSGDIANKEVPMRESGFNQEQNFNKEINIKLTQGQFIYAEYQQINTFRKVDLVNEGQFAISISPYVIVRRDLFNIATERVIEDSLDCKIGSQTPELKYAIKSFTAGLSGKLQKSEKLTTTDLQARGAVLTYISNFVAVTPQFKLFDDDTKYCTNKKIYRVDEVTTNIGTYKVADTSINGVLQNVECCNIGDVPSGFTCQNFKIVPLTAEETECSILEPCDLVAWTRSASKEVIRQDCVDNKCVLKRQEVECSSDSDCPGGICNFNVGDPTKNECLTIDPVNTCGNGICEESLGEGFQNCPRDCASKGKSQMLLYVLFGLLVIAIGVLFYLQFKKQRGKRK